MLDLLLGSTKYVDLAKKIIAEVKNGTVDNPNELLQKVANKYNLSDHEKQRVVEEYNVNYFLEKLQEGTQHENFVMMNPVMDECASVIGVDMDTPMDPKIGADIKKAASADFHFDVSAFSYDAIDRVPQVQYDTFDMSEEYLLKVASDTEKEKAKQQQQEQLKRALSAIDTLTNSVVLELVKTANISPSVAKNIVATLYKEAQDEDAAWTIVEQSKHKLSEIIEADPAKIYEDELKKLAKVSEKINLVRALKRIQKAIKQGADEEEIRKLIEELLAGTAAASYLAHLVHDILTNKANRQVQIDIREFIGDEEGAN